MAVAWVASPGYGGTVVLGPTQRVVLDVALRMTRGGRRPELTLGRLSSLTGRPVSSVHDALGRLRALGLLGVSARPGRRGGHRLWRVTSSGSSAQPLDRDRHRRAVARIIRRFGSIVARTRSLASDQSERDGPARAPLPGGPVTLPDGSTVQAPDPFGVTPADWTPAPKGSTFHDRMKRAGIGAWIDEVPHGPDRDS